VFGTGLVLEAPETTVDLVPVDEFDLKVPAGRMDSIDDTDVDAGIVAGRLLLVIVIVV
jgi:hypothetical protein